MSGWSGPSPAGPVALAVLEKLQQHRLIITPAAKHKHNYFVIQQECDSTEIFFKRMQCQTRDMNLVISSNSFKTLMFFKHCDAEQMFEMTMK